jgi:hypothetical protein
MFDCAIIYCVRTKFSLKVVDLMLSQICVPPIVGTIVALLNLSARLKSDRQDSYSDK